MFDLSNVVKGEYTDAMNENLWFKTTSVKKVVILSIKLLKSSLDIN